MISALATPLVFLGGFSGALIGAGLWGLGRKRYWDQHLWARGYFCASVGAVDEETIRRYIDNQQWDDPGENFKITAPTEP